MATLNELIAQLNASTDNILSDTSRLNTVADNIVKTIKELINVCTFEKLDLDKLPNFVSLVINCYKLHRHKS